MGLGGFVSSYLITVFVAWFGAHIVKYLISYSKDKTHKFGSDLFTSGGMPSSHSATAMALTTLIGLKDGIDSGLFGLATLFTLIVMYDATKVRRSTGEQGLAIQQLIKEQHSAVKLPRAAQGHTPLEVAIGACLGVLIGAVVFLSTR